MALEYRFKFILLFGLILFSVLPLTLTAQESDTQPKKPGLFIAPRADFSFYGRDSATIGGGLCIGYDGFKFASFGLNAVYIFPLGSDEINKVNGIEVTVFARDYPARWTGDSPANTGFFFQFNAGAILFSVENELFKNFDALTGCFGLTLGYRVPFGRHFYIEPAFRLGVPYIAAAELAIGIRF